MRKHKYNVSAPEKRRALGRTFGSQAEMRYAQQLELACQEGFMTEYICQPKFRLGSDAYFYVADFLVIPEGIDQRPYVVDVKGVETQMFKRHKMMWGEHGRLRLDVVKETSPGKFKVVESIGG